MLKKMVLAFGIVILVGGGVFKLSGLYDAMYSHKILDSVGPPRIDMPVRLVGWSWYSSECSLDANGRNALHAAIWDPIADARRAIARRDFRLVKLLGPYSSSRHLETSSFGNIVCSKNIPALKAPGWSRQSFAPDLISRCELFKTTVQNCYVILFNWEIFHSSNFPHVKYCSFDYSSLKDEVTRCSNTQHISKLHEIMDSEYIK